jgi:hypothetical protein
MKLILLFCFGVVLVNQVFCQSDPLTQAQGSRSQGMGNLKLNIPDSWAIFNHVGAMDRADQSQISAGYDSRFGLKELSTLSISGILKNEFGTLGAGISRFGGDLFNQHLLGLGFSNTLGIASIGAKAEWYQTQIEGFGTGNSFMLSFGGLAELGPKTRFGANFSNVNRARLGKNTAQKHPTLIQIGITYLPSDPIAIYAELEKEVDTKPILKVGLEYQPARWIQLRTGVNSQPARVSFGLGIRKDKFGFDYAYGQNTALGRTQHLSLALQLGEK